MHFTTEFATTSGWDVKPSWGTGWNARGSFSHGHVWDRIIFTGKTCLYPSRTYTTVIECAINFNVTLDMVKPKNQRMFSVTANTGYSEGSMNYNACLNSVGQASLNKKVTDFGYYSAKTSRRAVNATVEVAYTADGLTGKIADRKIIKLSRPYNTAPVESMNASLDCTNGWKTPGISSITDWTSNPCIDKGIAPVQCAAPNGVLVDVADEGSRSMRKFATGSTVEVSNSGRGRLVQFDQRVSGKGLTVNGYSTRFTRTGTPWNSSIRNVNKNYVELAQSATSPGLFESATSTKKIAGNDKTVYVWGYQASDPGGKTTLGQKVDWTGTQKMQSVAFTGVDASGKITTTPITVTVPTSGSCSQSIGLNYTRSVGSSR
ncbi:hypothetical protein ACWG8W_06370 [Citricoccus zhacaiensis]